MKAHTFFSLFLCLLFTSAMSAQMLEQGNFVIGTTFGFSTADSKIIFESSTGKEEGEGPSALQINIAPNIGYFIVPNFALGIGLDYTYSSVSEPSEDRTQDSDLLFGPFGRAYLPVTDDMSFFVEADFGFGNSSDEQIIGGNTQSIKTNIFAIGVGPGFTIFSNSSIGIEALLKYNYARSKFKTENAGVESTTITKTNQFDVAIGVQFYFGGVRRLGQ